MELFSWVWGFLCGAGRKSLSANVRITGRYSLRGVRGPIRKGALGVAGRTIIEGGCEVVLDNVSQWAGRFGVCFLGLGLVFGGTGCSILYDRLGGPYSGRPQKAFDECGLSSEARTLVEAAFRGTEGRTMVDYHVHFFGNGCPTNYTYAPELQSMRDLDPPQTNFRRFVRHQKPQYQLFVEGLYLDTIDVRRRATMDEDYMKRLVELIAWFGSPAFADRPAESPHQTDFFLYAMDGIYNSDGHLDSDTFNYVSNAYTIGLAEALNKKIGASKGFVKNRVVPVGSINPLRKSACGSGVEMRNPDDWKAEVNLLAKHGVRWIKWRPPSMGIDPDRVSDEFYEMLATKGIGILTHTGDSKGIELRDELDQFAGPRKMRRAVSLGVDVVMLHIGRAGTNICTNVSFAQEFLDELRYPHGPGAGRLQGEISAVPYAGTENFLKPILDSDPLLDGRIVNGSDYPAVTPWFTVRKTLSHLRDEGWIAPTQRSLLREVFEYNPLLFDFVLKRSLRFCGKGLPTEIFLREDSGL